MKDRPILFQGAMVRALLNGSKTQTRRVFKLPSGHRWDELQGGMPSGNIECDKWPGTWHVSEFRNPYGQPGDQLWVRESWSDNSATHVAGVNQRVYYRADYPSGSYNTVLRWRPSIHMPRWASRITLEITGVRVERLQDISENDAKAEGCTVWTECEAPAAYNLYRALWDQINGPESWNANPWVWCVEFKVMKP